MIALSRIVHGGEGGERTIFAPGDEVKGLSEDVVKSLKVQNLVASKQKAYLLRPELFPEPPVDEEVPVAKAPVAKKQEE